MVIPRPKTIDVIKTGFQKFDQIFGGLPVKEVIEVCDHETACGKTSIALHFAKHLTNQKLPVVYIDLEQNLSPRVIKSRSIDPNYLIVVTSLETSILKVCSLGSIVVIDSVASLEGPRKALRIIRETTDAPIVALNQSRFFIQSYTVSNKSMDQWSRFRMTLTNSGTIKYASSIIGKNVKVTVTDKHSINREASFTVPLLFRTGIKD